MIADNRNFVLSGFEQSMSWRRSRASKYSSRSARAFARPLALAFAIGLSMTVIVIVTATGRCFAQEEPAKSKRLLNVPMPPERPANIDTGAPAVTAPISPAPTVTWLAPAAAPARGFRPLPAASRERMHACGLEWQKMKMDGTARDKTWRDFADVCLSK